MRSPYLTSILVLSLFLLCDISQARSSKPKQIDGGSDSGGDAWSKSTYVSPNEIARRIARSASSGVGYSAGSPYCYRAVKSIIADGLGKNLGCVRGIITGGSAKNAGAPLERAGFVRDMSKCRTPGAILVYDGRKVPGKRASAGTFHGHIEVVGEDGLFHFFMTTRRPIDESRPGERVLTGCYYPDGQRIARGPLSQCSASHKNSSSGSQKLNVDSGVD